jgi:hypothetical protein
MSAGACSLRTRRAWIHSVQSVRICFTDTSHVSTLLLPVVVRGVTGTAPFQIIVGRSRKVRDDDFVA